MESVLSNSISNHLSDIQSKLLNILQDLPQSEIADLLNYLEEVLLPESCQAQPTAPSALTPSLINAPSLTLSARLEISLSPNGTLRSAFLRDVKTET